MVMFGFVYWPESESPTKILFRFLWLCLELCSSRKGYFYPLSCQPAIRLSFCFFVGYLHVWPTHSYRCSIEVRVHLLVK